MKIVLAGCVKSKRRGSHPAADLYDSPLFRGRRAYAEANADRWYILSALHGLVAPDDEVIEWYEQAMASLSRSERKAWSMDVLDRLDALEPNLADVIVEMHAGAEYVRWGLAHGLRDRGADVQLPLAHLGIGRQLRWYADLRK